MNLKIRNHSIHRNTRDRRTEHHQSHIRDVAEDPNSSTYSDRGFQDFLLLINIFHIITIMGPPDMAHTAPGALDELHATMNQMSKRTNLCSGGSRK